MVSIRHIVTYKIFINKQLIYANVTIRLALFIYINIPVRRLSSSCSKLTSDVGNAVLAILSHEDAYNSVDSFSSKDVAVVIDFHWFTDCHLEAIFNMNASRESQSSSTVDGKDVRLTIHQRFSLNPPQHDILPHRQSQLSDLTIRLHITTSLKSISQKR